MLAVNRSGREFPSLATFLFRADPARKFMTSGNSSRAAWSRRSILTGLAAVAVAPVLPAHAAGDPSAKAFLQQIYQNYVGSSGGAAKGVPLAGAKEVRGYFTVGLATLILEDRASAAKRGEPPALDGDPFVGHQDWDISNLAIEVKDTGGAKVIGTVSFANSGKAEKVVVELLRSGKDWRIADIQWDASSLRSLYRKKATVGDAYPVR
jgi:Protein of unknown function (DUF3828)